MVHQSPLNHHSSSDSSMSISSPPRKRINLGSSSPESPSEQNTGDHDIEEDQCSICLQPIVDRALIPKCSHEFCFECLTVWSEQSRRCPLCSQGVGEYLIHHIRSKYDYQKYYLLPLRTSPLPLQPLSVSDSAQSTINRRRPRREREWGRRERREREEADQLERSISKRRWIYRNHLYAKHVASNVYTRYRPFPTPAQFATSADHMSRATTFIRRELQVWPNLDVEFLTTFILSVMKSIDIRAESAIKLLSEFLDMDEPYVEGVRNPNAEHFAHELYCYLRSPYRDLYVYDTIVQYDLPSDLPPPPIVYQRTSRWQPRPASRSSSPSSISSSNSSVHMPVDQYRRTPSEMPTAPRSHRHPRSRSRSRSMYDKSDGSETRDDHVQTGDHHTVRFPNRSISEDMTPEIVDTVQVGVKGKGKAREMDSGSQSSRAIEQSMDGIVDSSAPMRSPGTTPNFTTVDRDVDKIAEPSPSEAPRHGERVRGRGRTLLESVHSHLSLPLTSVRSSARKRDRLGLDPLDPAPVTTACPSLLARLSDRGTHNTNTSSLDPNQPVTQGLAQPSPGTPSSSVPDIMTRARVRLAKLKNESAAAIPPSVLTPLASPVSPSAFNAPSSLCRKLLDKLEEERRQVNDGAQALSVPTTEIKASPNPGGAPDCESLKTESNLRMQAQLKVRLAAAKRAHNNYEREG